MFLAATVSVAAVPVMHEQMHQRAEQDEQERQRAKEVRLMLGEEKETKHHSKRQPNPREYASLWRRLVGTVDTRHRLILVA
jgi:hypothetical protein